MGTQLKKRAGWYGDFDRISLHPDNRCYEAHEPARVATGQVFEIAYEEMIEELRDRLGNCKRHSFPVYPFAYDWRLPLNKIELKLADFIKEVIERTKLMGRRNNNCRNCKEAAYQNCREVNLIGHSMGGLIIAGYLANCLDKQEESKVGKVVSLASPFQGSYEAVVRMTTGTTNWDIFKQSSRERKAARLTPSLYHLVPSFKGALRIENEQDGYNVPVQNLEENSDSDMRWFDKNIWQTSIIESIADHIDEYSGIDSSASDNPEERKDRAFELLDDFLQDAKRHRRKINKLDLEKVGIGKDNWLCVIGVNAKTRVTLPIKFKEDGTEFDLKGSVREDRWAESGSDQKEECRKTGDGTVPFEGAIPQFLDYESLVCVTPDDFGYWEFQDKSTSFIAGFHGILPNMNLLHRLIVRYFNECPDSHGNTWARRPPGAKRWNPPIDLEEKE